MVTVFDLEKRNYRTISVVALGNYVVDPDPEIAVALAIQSFS